MSLIKSYIEESMHLRDEIKRNNEKNRVLRKRVQILEENIVKYLNEKGQTGIKYNNKVISIENKPLIQRKKKKDKDNDTISLLKEWGINNPDEAYLRLQTVQRGISAEISKIKFSDIK